MGFWSPQTLVADARRHGVVVRRPCVNASAAKSTLEPDEHSTGGAAVRLGIEYVRTLGQDLAADIAAGRPYVDMEDLVRRHGSRLTLPRLEALATAGAFACFGLSRRQALWAAGAVAQGGPGHLEGVVTGAAPPPLPDMSEPDENAADLWATGLSPETYPTQFVRHELDRMGVVTAAGLPEIDNDARVLVGGVVTHRQRPATAQGTTFLNLEDETGLINVICSAGVWARYRRAARSAPAMLVRGRLEKVETVINVVADRITPLTLSAKALRSRDFR